MEKFNVLAWDAEGGGEGGKEGGEGGGKPFVNR
jgi:hypothetical protein